MRRPIDEKIMTHFSSAIGLAGPPIWQFQAEALERKENRGVEDQSVVSSADDDAENGGMSVRASRH
jgi:hypothetical protein